jgi:hypothetical protein
MIPLFSQGFAYTYDNNGTRLTRTVKTQQLQSKSLADSVISLKSLNTSYSQGSGVESQTDQKSDESNNISMEGDIKTIVYPNPNMGLVKIDVSNMPENSINEMKLYDLTGMELVSKKNFDSYSELDISQYRDGIYILRIKINGKLFDWKIIKGQISNH